MRLRPAAVAVAGVVIAQRVAELALSRRNERRLRARGAVEYGRRHYPAMVLLHGTWIAAMLLEGSGDGARRHRGWALVALAVQPLRYWVIASLGDRWTTRVLVPPGDPPIARGPYRRLRHPNYAVVAVEIASLPLAVGARTTALAFTIANAALMAVRIPTEDRALRSTISGDRRVCWEPA